MQFVQAPSFVFGAFFRKQALLPRYPASRYPSTMCNDSISSYSRIASHRAHVHNLSPSSLWLSVARKTNTLESACAIWRRYEDSRQQRILSCLCILDLRCWRYASILYETICHERVLSSSLEQQAAINKVDP